LLKRSYGRKKFSAPRPAQKIWKNSLPKNLMKFFGRCCGKNSSWCLLRNCCGFFLLRM
jgi:hypothetical protein